MNFPYCISEQRELTRTEYELLEFLFQKEKKEWLEVIHKLKVIGRCGCGKCPTIMLGIAFEDVPKKNQKIYINYKGLDNNGHPIGVFVSGNDDMPTEVEFWSIDGQVENCTIPTLETLCSLGS